MTDQERFAERRRQLLETDLRVLKPIARRLARKAGDRGVTVDNLRLYVETKGVVLVGSTGRAYLSTLYSRVMANAGLVPIANRYARTMRRGNRGGNLVQIWRLPNEAEAA